MGTHTGPISHWVEQLTIAIWGHTLHTGPIPHWDGQLTIAIWGHTLDQYHTGLRQVEVLLTIALWDNTLDQHYTGFWQLKWIDTDCMGTHTRSALHWVQAVEVG